MSASPKRKRPRLPPEDRDSCCNRIQVRAMHLDAAPDFEQLGAKQGRVESSTSAYLVKIPIIFEQKFLSFAASAQRSHAPVFHSFHNHGRP